MRFSSEPPYSSVRRLVSGVMKARQQIAVGAMDLEPCRSRHALGHSAARTNSSRDARPCRRASSPAAPDCAATIGDRRRRDQRPVAGLQRLVHFLPAELGRALGDRRGRADMPIAAWCGHARSRRCASRPRLCSSLHMPAQPGEMRAVGRHAGHFGEDEAGAAMGAAADMHQIIIVRHAVAAGILRHRRHHDAVGQVSARAARNGVNIGATARWRRAPLFCAIQVSTFAHIVLVAQPQIFVGDALRARQQAVGELLGVEMV